MKQRHIRPNSQRNLEGRVAVLEQNAAMMQTLQQVSSIYVREGNLELALNQILDAAISVTQADMGNIQLYEPTTRNLRIAVHRGFGPAFLEFWNGVSEGNGSCGTAFNRLERVIVEDVTKSPIFVGTPALAVQLEAQVRAVQSTPLVSRSGELLGMVSTHYKTPRSPERRIFPFLDLLARQAADILERAHADDRQRLLLHELNHRVNNTLAIVQAIAAQTLRATPEPADFVERFTARLEALSGAHNLLTQQAWRHARLDDIVRAALSPFSSGDVRINISARGAIVLPANMTITLNLMLHEFAANAAKYGALSSPQGRVEIGWYADDASTVHFEWSEHDGPPIKKPPDRKGFGSRLIEISAAQLQAELNLDYARSGLRCLLSFPLPAADTGASRVGGKTFSLETLTFTTESRDR
jgi:two-component sensor histidine kinase